MKEKKTYLTPETKTYLIELEGAFMAPSGVGGGGDTGVTSNDASIGHQGFVDNSIVETYKNATLDDSNTGGF